MLSKSYPEAFSAIFRGGPKSYPEIMATAKVLRKGVLKICLKRCPESHPENWPLGKVVRKVIREGLRPGLRKTWVSDFGF